MILRIKKSYGVSPYVVYCPSNFKFHTHCWSRDVAYIIKKNVDSLRVPKTKDIRLLKSHIRVSDNEDYIDKIRQRIDYLQTKGGRKMIRKVYVTKRFEFEAAHKLPDYKGACSNIHGHSYKLEVTLSGCITNSKSLNSSMVLDFKMLKSVVMDSVVKKYDHKLLNDFFEYPTAESMVVDMYFSIKQGLERLPYELPASEVKNFNDKCIKIETVKLWETADSYAEYRGE